MRGSNCSEVAASTSGLPAGRPLLLVLEPAVLRAYDLPMSTDHDERDALASRACGDIPPQFCTVVDVDISGEEAKVWLLTNDASHFERYQVNFIRDHDTWVESLSAGGFQTGTPDDVHVRARRLEGRA